MKETQLDALRDHLEHQHEMQVLQVLAIIQDNENISTKEIRDKTGLPGGTVSARIRDLESEGLIYYTGKKKVGKRSYSTYRYESNSVKQAENRMLFNAKLYREDTIRYFKKYKEKLPQRAIAIFTEMLQEDAA